MCAPDGRLMRAIELYWAAEQADKLKASVLHANNNERVKSTYDIEYD
jgi:hypothetical protein